MTFEERLDQVLALLQRRGRVAYRAVQCQFDLDDASLADVMEALLSRVQPQRLLTQTST